MKFFRSKARQWAAVLLSALFALGIIIGEGEYMRRIYEREYVMRVEQPHLGQERGDESPTLIVNAPSIYANVAANTYTHTYRPGSLVPTVKIPPRG